MSAPSEARPPIPQDAAPAAPAQYGAELGDDDLEQVVGGLARVYGPGMYAAPD